MVYQMRGGVNVRRGNPPFDLAARARSLRADFLSIGKLHKICERFLCKLHKRFFPKILDF